MQSSGALLVCALALSTISLVSSVEDFEMKPTKKPNKLFKDQFHHKPSYSFPDTDSDDLENPFIPPPVPRNGEDASPWSWFLNQNPREFPNQKADDKKDGKPEEAEAEATRAQRFIGATGIDPFFYSNPLTPLSPPSPPRRQTGYGFNYNNYNYYPYELFMVVQPKLCSNSTDNSTDVAIKFLSGSSSPEPSRCTFAIASCCAPFNYHVRYPCFEMLGCYNAFWDMNPCTDDVVAVAVDELSKFYKSDPAPDNSTATVAPASTPAPPPAAESYTTSKCQRPNMHGEK